jgi:hypothetical protein
MEMMEKLPYLIGIGPIILSLSKYMIYSENSPKISSLKMIPILKNFNKLCSPKEDLHKKYLTI